MDESEERHCDVVLAAGNRRVEWKVQEVVFR